MINLRFHIVSIVAIFLALAIGMFAGSTLLDRATIDVLKGRQRSLDSRNSRLRAENEELRAAIAAADAAEAAFGDEPMTELLPDLLGDVPVLIVAARGIDEGSVRATRDALGTAGAAPLGIVWVDGGVDLDDVAARNAVAAALDIGPGQATKASVVRAFAAPIVESASAPTTTVPVGDEAAPPPTSGTLGVLRVLAEAGRIDWESPTDGEPGPRLLPPSGLQVVFVAGEGATLRPGSFMYPVIRAVAAEVPGVAVAEVRTPRTDLQAIEDDATPRRGEFVDRLRVDDDLAARLITVDDLDAPFGRLALVLALAQLPDVTAGAYGSAPTAASRFPTDG